MQKYRQLQNISVKTWDNIVVLDTLIEGTNNFLITILLF